MGWNKPVPENKHDYPTVSSLVNNTVFDLTMCKFFLCLEKLKFGSFSAVEGENKHFLEIIHIIKVNTIIIKVKIIQLIVGAKTST